MTRPLGLADLVPAFYRLRDEREGDGLLTALLAVLEQGAVDLQHQLEDRYDDLFVETCGPEELAHVAALLGVRELAGRRAQRAFLADVMGSRRRKGTISALEDLARATSGWTAKATEQFPLLVATVALSAPRPDFHATVSLRDPAALEGTTVPFDPRATTPDLRSVEAGLGRRGLRQVAVDLWRLGPVPERRPATPVPGDLTRFRFHPLGIDRPLWTRGDPEPSQEHRLERPDVSEPLGLREALTWWDRLYGPAGSFAVRIDGDLVERSDVRPCDLGDVSSGSWAPVPPGARVALDPTRGRLAFAADPGGRVDVSYYRVLPMPLGGGGYPGRVPAAHEDEPETAVVRLAADGTGDVVTLDDAWARLAGAAGTGVDGVVEVGDSARYAASGAVTVAPGGHLVLRAATGEWPVLTAGLRVVCPDDARVTLDGLLVTGGPVLVTGRPARVTISHCTLVPGGGLSADGRPLAPDQPSLRCDLDGTVAVHTDVEVGHSVLGAVAAPADLVRLVVDDSIVSGEPVRRPAYPRAVCVGGPVAPGGPAAVGRVRVGVGLAVEADLDLVVDTADLTATAAALEAALRGAAGSDLDDSLRGREPATAQLSVGVHGDRLVVVGADLDPVRFSDLGADPSATRLGLTDAAVSVTGVLGRPGADPPVMAGVDLALSGTLRNAAGPDRVVPVTAALLTAPVSLAQAGTALETSLVAGAGAGPRVVALVLGGRLLVAPTRAGEELSVTPSPLASALGLAVGAPALSGDGGRTVTGPALVTRRSTWLGDVITSEVEASDCLFVGTLTAARRQSGCLRFSWVGAGSRTPHRFRCRAAEAGDPAPAFETLAFTAASYAQLRATCPSSVATGAEDGAEMGAFHDVDQPGRVSAVRSLFDDYLRFDARAGVFLAR